MPPNPALQLDESPEVNFPETVNTIRKRRTHNSPLRALVILVEFTDKAYTYAATTFDDLVFGTQYDPGNGGPTDRTVYNYYQEISYGDLEVVTVNLPSTLGWPAMPNLYTYYSDTDGIPFTADDYGFGPYPNNVQRLVIDAVTAADATVDFSDYDQDGDGEVDTLFIVHTGTGAEWHACARDIWSHAWDIREDDGFGNIPPATVLDGVTIGAYSMEPEHGGNPMGYFPDCSTDAGAALGPFPPTAGVYAHELGHVLGLPDEYDYGYESVGTGRFSLMAAGSWNRYPDEVQFAGNSPAHPSAWGRVQLGFVTPIIVGSTTTCVDIPPVETDPTIYKLPIRKKEYFLVENRQQIGFDQGLVRLWGPEGTEHGMVIYHIDEDLLDRNYWRANEAECWEIDNCNCTTPAWTGETHYGIAVEQADGLYELEHYFSLGDSEDFWPGALGKTTFDSTTVPNTSSYYRTEPCETTVKVWDINEVGTTIAACLEGQAVPIGGIAVPVNRLELLAPWMGLVTLAGLAALWVVLARRRED